MSTVVFLGPSLDRDAAARRLSAHYLPPARRGDIGAAAASGARRIALIDGEFGQSLAVTVMEIRAAIEGGAEVWGSSSMGALRAGECGVLGMRGAGWIFEQYASGTLTSDDEVALLFDPRSGQARTLPLVNLRWVVSVMQQRRLLTPVTATEVVRIGAALHFTERSRAALASAAAGTTAEAPMQRVLAWMEENPEQCDRKRMDALILLERLAAAASTLPECSPSQKPKQGASAPCGLPNSPASIASPFPAVR